MDNNCDTKQQNLFENKTDLKEKVMKDTVNLIDLAAAESV
jgi:hypothetical protein